VFLPPSSLSIWKTKARYDLIIADKQHAHTKVGVLLLLCLAAKRLVATAENTVPSSPLEFKICVFYGYIAE
jgi:hypothetical protein